MELLTLRAYAKINLHLDITGRREDGYHCVNNVMQSVSLCDTVRMRLREDGQRILRCDHPALACDERNLAWRAAMLLLESVKEEKGFEIEIEKRIPMQAGLAGGSTDAAAVLAGMNLLLGRPLTKDALCALGARLGADVPFCIAGGTSFADGVGEQLHTFPAMPDCHIVLACAGEGVSTPWAFAALDARYASFDGTVYQPHPLDALRSAMADGCVHRVAEGLYNVFEDVILSERPVAAHLRSVMLSSGALGALMSGSGPSVYAIMPHEAAAQATVQRLKQEGIPAFAVRPVAKQDDRF